jgi:hypothetical protein
LKRTLQLAGIVALGFASLLLWRSAQFVRAAEMEMKSRSAQLGSVLEHADQAAQQSVDVSRDTRRSIVHFDRTIGDLRVMVANTDHNLNGRLLPELTATAIQTRQAASSLTLRANEVAPILEHADQAMLRLDDLASSPEIHEAMRSIASGTQHADQTTANVQAMSEEVRQAIYEMRHPSAKSRGARALDFIIRIVLGNAIQGAVRR